MTSDIPQKISFCGLLLLLFCNPKGTRSIRGLACWFNPQTGFSISHKNGLQPTLALNQLANLYWMRVWILLHFFLASFYCIFDKIFFSSLFRVSLPITFYDFSQFLSHPKTDLAVRALKTRSFLRGSRKHSENTKEKSRESEMIRTDSMWMNVNKRRAEKSLLLSRMLAGIYDSQ